MSQPLLMNPVQKCFAKGLLGGRTSPSSMRLLVALPFIALVVFQLAAGEQCQKPVIFQYSGTDQWRNLTFQVPNPAKNAPNAEITQIDSDSFVTQGDFQLNGTMMLFQNATSSNVKGKWVYNKPVQLIRPCSCPSTIVTSFSTMFEVAITAQTMYGYFTGATTLMEGLAFIMVLSDSTTPGPDVGADGGYLGWLNNITDRNATTPHNFAVELDTITNVEFQDPSYAHIGVDVNSLISVATSNYTDWSGGLVPFGETTVIIWIEYDGSSKLLKVFGAWSGGADCEANHVFSGAKCKPTTPMISQVLDLTETIAFDPFMNIGFSASISYTDNNSINNNVWGYKINGWTFNSDGPAPDLPRTTNPGIEAGKEKAKGNAVMILAATIPSIFLLLVLMFTIYLLYRRNARLTALAKKYEIEIGVLDRGPQNFKYKLLSKATKEFSSDALLGSGGFGSVYKGRLVLKGDGNPTDIAVKRISATSNQGAREFLAEVKIIGQVQHRNLVRLLGWCHEKGELLLVYEYMPNGSVDQHLFKAIGGESILTWARRLKIASGVATALAYLHEEWEQRVIHRDVKSSNVMLDRDFNARLGDFGLARLSAHDQAPQSTAVLAGTYGYLAPELAHTLKSTEKTDVYSFGAMVLEVATGKRPLFSLEDQKIFNEVLLVDWVWGLYRDDALLDASDPRLQKGFDPGEMIMFLKIGLLCSHPDPDVRPTMREVLNIWKGSSPFPSLPRTKPVPIFISCVEGLGPDTTFTIPTDPQGNSDASWDGSFMLDSDGHTTPTDTYALGSSQLGRHPTLRYRRSNTTTALPM